jgi:hypothetical protein
VAPFEIALKVQLADGATLDVVLLELEMFGGNRRARRERREVRVTGGMLLFGLFLQFSVCFALSAVENHRFGQ